MKHTNKTTKARRSTSRVKKSSIYQSSNCDGNYAHGLIELIFRKGLTKISKEQEKIKEFDQVNY
jgi:hypothetical protein